MNCFTVLVFPMNLYLGKTVCGGSGYTEDVSQVDGLTDRKLQFVVNGCLHYVTIWEIRGSTLSSA